jgi:hypothetical protein
VTPYIPRPALALLFVYPMTTKAKKWHEHDVAAEEEYNGTGAEPVWWVRQEVINGTSSPMCRFPSLSIYEANSMLLGRA